MSMYRKKIEFRNYDEATEYINENKYEFLDMLENWINNDANLDELEQLTELIEKVAQYHEDNN